MADKDTIARELLEKYAESVVNGEPLDRVNQCADAYVKARYGEPPKIPTGATPAEAASRLRVKGHDEFADLLDRGLPTSTGHTDSETLYGRLYEGYDFLQHVGNKQMVSSKFLIKGELVRSTVAQVVDNIPGVPPKYLWHGSGFLVGENLFMTNHHVLPNKVVAARCRTHFDYVTDLGTDDDEAEVEARFHALDPEKFWYTNPELDYTIVYVEPDSVDGKTGRVPIGLYWSKLYDESPKALPGERVNIIQHPDGQSQRLALRLNKITKRDQSHFFYKASTRSGSSGSPVMNDSWQLVGLHQASAGSSNQGIRASVIAADLQKHVDSLEGSAQRLGKTCFTDPPMARDRKKLLKVLTLFEFLNVVAEAGKNGGDKAAQKAGEDWVDETVQDIELMQKKYEEVYSGGVPRASDSAESISPAAQSLSL